MDSYKQRLAKRRAESEARRDKWSEEFAGPQAERTTPKPAGIRKKLPATRGKRGRIVMYVIGVYLLAGAVLLTALTLSRLGGEEFSDDHRTGTAHVTQCTEQGPVTSRGFGYWERCTVKVDWDNGLHDTLSLEAVLTSADIGTDIRISERNVSTRTKSGFKRNDKTYAVEDAPTRPWLARAGFVLSLIAIIPFILLMLVIVFTLKSTMKWYWFGPQQQKSGEPVRKVTGWVWLRRIALLALAAWLAFRLVTWFEPLLSILTFP